MRCVHRINCIFSTFSACSAFYFLHPLFCQDSELVPFGCYSPTPSAIWGRMVYIGRWSVSCGQLPISSHTLLPYLRCVMPSTFSFYLEISISHLPLSVISSVLQALNHQRLNFWTLRSLGRISQPGPKTWCLCPAHPFSSL